MSGCERERTHDRASEWHRREARPVAHGFEKFDAYQLLTQVGELYVGNMVDNVYSLVARCPKRHLPG